MSKTKTYWKGYSEKHQTPEFSISSQKEFQDDVPVDEFLNSDGLDDLKTGRRDFLKFMGFSVAAATLASCESPRMSLCLFAWSIYDTPSIKLQCKEDSMFKL